ncbi:universal stress protein [Tsukamurella spumae]|uniref:Universal stress protein n=1 Tax=Tsukamurella spumae TaxID=44753 RepID=A0A846WW90_9ACTN|nr:universal stress protein [Tsukamurella spumae]
MGVDGSDRSLDAVRWAAAEAVRRGKPLVIASAADTAAAALGFNLTASDSFYRYLEGRTDEALAAAKAAARETRPEVEIGTVSGATKPVDLLTSLSENSVLTVVGDTGASGFSRALIGSVAQGVARKVTGPVAVVRGTAAADGAVVVGVDGSEVSATAVRAAFEEASARGVDLIAVHAWTDLPASYAAAYAAAYDIDWEAERTREEAALAENLAGYADEFPDVTVARVVTRGDATAALVHHSEGASLVVVGSHGRGAVGAFLLGSVSGHVIAHSASPVLIVRNPVQS